jgi:hypothetical protein
MVKSGRIAVTVDFSVTKRPAQYLLEINPEGGAVVGSWGGSAMIDDKNRHTFDNVPPGRYVLVGRPNPGNANQQTPAVTVDVKGGEKLAVELQAK